MARPLVPRTKSLSRPRGLGVGRRRVGRMTFSVCFLAVFTGPRGRRLAAAAWGFGLRLRTRGPAVAGLARARTLPGVISGTSEAGTCVATNGGLKVGEAPAPPLSNQADTSSHSAMPRFVSLAFGLAALADTDTMGCSDGCTLDTDLRRGGTASEAGATLWKVSNRAALASSVS